jgi:uncharacterized protein (UPF0261 family)
MIEKRKRIGIVSTMDTKGEECAFLKEQIERLGYHVVVIDVGVMGEARISTDISRQQIACAGGRELEKLREAARAGADRTDATKVMIEGVKKLLAEAYKEGRVDGLIGLGGSTGSSIAVEAMRALPVGVPKLIVTTVLDLLDVEVEDTIALFQSPCDIIGVNSISKSVFARAA